MAELYLAHQRGAAGFTKIVALKRILPHLAEDPMFTGMFLDEARLASGLTHPNLAQVLDFGEYGGEHFLTMEYVHGRNLLQVLRATKAALPIGAALEVVLRVARGLHDLHEHRAPDGRVLGLVHRDVSPANVLVSHEGTVKLTDFGIAKAMELTTATRTGTFKGKLGHSSPEQARGESIDRRSDVFCLGILLYEVTTGARAFSGPNEFAVLGKVARASYVPPRELVPGYPAALADIVAKALQVDAADRFATAAALADAVVAFAREADVGLGSDAVASVMLAQFGPAPPVVDAAELELADTVTLQSEHAAVAPEPPRARRSWVPYAAVPLALLVGALGMRWFGGDVEAATPRAVGSVDAPTPSSTAEAPSAAPVVVDVEAPAPTPDPVVAQAEAPPESEPPPEPKPPEPQAQPEPTSVTPPPRKRPRKRKRPKAKAAPAPSKSDALRDVLYPPGS